MILYHLFSPSLGSLLDQEVQISKLKVALTLLMRMLVLAIQDNMESAGVLWT